MPPPTAVPLGRRSTHAADRSLVAAEELLVLHWFWAPCTKGNDPPLEFCSVSPVLTC